MTDLAEPGSSASARQSPARRCREIPLSTHFCLSTLERFVVSDWGTAVSRRVDFAGHSQPKHLIAGAQRHDGRGELAIGTVTLGCT